jgi:hypothetical protein
MIGKVSITITATTKSNTCCESSRINCRCILATMGLKRFQKSSRYVLNFLIIGIKFTLGLKTFKPNLNELGQQNTIL